MLKMIARLILTISFAVLFPHSAYSFNVTVTPDTIKPGDVALLTVSNTDLPVKAEFRGSKIELHKVPVNRLVALIAVDVNTEPDNYAVSVMHGKEERHAGITVVPHAFRTIHLTLPEGKVTLSPENQKRAVREAKLQNAIWSKITSMSWEGRFVRPTNTETSTEFGVKRIMNKKKTSVHRGIDFRGKTGTPVKSINSGKVVLTEDLFFGGNTVVVDHGMGLYSIYMHLSRFKTEKGKAVSKGDVIGLIGSSGRATGPHLHMSVKLNGMSINPESLFDLDI